MKEQGKVFLKKGITLIVVFIFWTVLVQRIDVQSIGPMDSNVGLSTINRWFHHLTGTNMGLYVITDWLGLVPVIICLMFGTMGSIQLIKRKSLWKVDRDLVILGIYYLLVICGYLIFEMIPINYRPILIDGRMEASYPSSTTLLVLSVIPTLVFQTDRRIRNKTIRRMIKVSSVLFSGFMVVGRLISGVHWFTDIVGSVLLSMGLFSLYKAAVYFFCDH